MKTDLKKYNGDSDTFANDFTLSVSSGKVYIEQFSDGAIELETINTAEKYILLKSLLVGGKIQMIFTL